jgi:hypothetical protein
MKEQGTDFKTLRNDPLLAIAGSRPYVAASASDLRYYLLGRTPTLDGDGG